MRLGTVSAGVMAWAGAALSSLCCLLLLAIIVLGPDGRQSPHAGHDMGGKQ